ncbi:hypothetical protein FBUS_02314 [Fasciolopsis buskii]|uniref:Uncharacterized protein n=1 Tax=Fasciolopsis buskii TaxID=27845 RepID=A0A8E0VJA6_9TREM|nr:hypothetical protein FBUS_02314 [Fasciolopsis buski]
MATKILRLASDKKTDGAQAIWEDDYREQIENLERKNATLSQKPGTGRPVNRTNMRTLVGTPRENRGKDSAATGALQTARMQNAALDTLKENIDLIRNQRELREKQLQISTLQARIQDFEADQTAMKEANRKLVAEVERLTNEVGLLEQKIIHTESAATLATKDHLKVLEIPDDDESDLPRRKTKRGHCLL